MLTSVPSVLLSDLIIMFIMLLLTLTDSILLLLNGLIAQYKVLSLPSLIIDGFMSFRRNGELGQADKEMSAGHVPPDGWRVSEESFQPVRRAESETERQDDDCRCRTLTVWVLFRVTVRTWKLSEHRWVHSWFSSQSNDLEHFLLTFWTFVVVVVLLHVFCISADELFPAASVSSVCDVEQEAGVEGRLDGHLPAGGGRHGVRGQPGRQQGELGITRHVTAAADMLNESLCVSPGGVMSDGGGGGSRRSEGGGDAGTQ